MTEENKVLVEALLVALPILGKYGSRERNPDDEAWAAFSLAVNALDKNGVNLFGRLESA